MPDLRAYARFASDAENLLQRSVDAAGLRPLVGEIGAAVTRGDLGQSDQLFGRGVEVGNVLERGGYAKGAVEHRLIHQRLHAGQLLRCRGPVLASKDDRAHGARAYEGSQVHPRAAALEELEVAAERRPAGPHAVLAIDVLVLLEQLLVERSDGLPLTRDFGGDSLHHLRGGPRIDEQVVLGLAEKVDETRRDYQVAGVDPPRRGSLAERPHGGDPPVAHAYVGDEPGRPRAIDDPSAGEDQFEARVGLGGR